MYNYRIYHPNVEDPSGKVCEAILGEWSPALTVSHILQTMYTMLVDPSPDQAVNPEIGNLLKNNRTQFDKNVR